jgi:protein-S-isoprenylcysteine O-methyltransferase Ste14
MKSQGLLSLAVRNLFFTILQPGMVAGLIPYYIARDSFRNYPGHALRFHHYTGMLLFLTGLLILFNCIIRFAVEGRGTLSPVDPTRRLVTTGLYRISRNPMYVGVMMILAGEAVFVQSANLWIYTGLLFLAFNLFIIFWEEPRLRKDFGKDYDNYCGNVRRWI